MKTHHTPTPWKAEYDEANDRKTNIISNNTFIAETAGLLFDGKGGDEEDYANAEFIVRVVNSHEALLKTLERAREIIDGLSYGQASTLKMIDRAIDLAEGKENL